MHIIEFKKHCLELLKLIFQKDIAQISNIRSSLICMGSHLIQIGKITIFSWSPLLTKKDLYYAFRMVYGMVKTIRGGMPQTHAAEPEMICLMIQNI